MTFFPGMDSLAGGGGCTPPALARGGAIFHDKQKIIRGQNEIQ